jgi:hypothetical protein
VPTITAAISASSFFEEKRDFMAKETPSYNFRATVRRPQIPVNTPKAPAGTCKSPCMPGPRLHDARPPALYIPENRVLSARSAAAVAASQISFRHHLFCPCS